MTKEEIDDIKIEHRGEQRYWNITMFVVPMRGNRAKVPCYAELVEMAECIAPVYFHSWEDFAKYVRKLARRVWRDWRDHDD